MPADRRTALGIVPHKAYTIYPESSKAKREDADESYSHPPPSKEKREDADESYAIHPPSTKARREDADEAYYIPPADGMPAF